MPRPPPVPPANWACFLDFDGTLVELAPTPDAISVDPGLPALLATLHRRLGGALAVITGRALADLDRWLELPQLPRSGLHGLERYDATGRRFRHVTPAGLHERVSEAYAALAARHAGLRLEDKGPSVAIHYRQAPEMEAEVWLRLESLVGQFDETLTVQHGKYVAELRPAGIDKGSAVAEFLAEPPFAGRSPVFIGDDLGDMHAFAVVEAHGGLSIAVGRDDLGARYVLPDVAAVHAWLRAAGGTPA